jgi:hypothetical protein
MMLPLAQASRTGSRVSLWGQVRPGTGSQRYVLQRLSGSRWIAVGGSRVTSARGYFTVSVVAPKGTHFRISYPAGHATSPDLVVR